MNTPSKQPQNSKKQQQRSSSDGAAGMGAIGLDQDSSVANGSQAKESEGRSFISVISDKLPDEAKQAVEQAYEKASEYVAKGKEYFAAQPAQAALIGVTVGLAAIALLYTRPGRRIVQMAALTYVPNVTSWLSSNFGAQVKH